jgi:hypothetical protein
VAVLINWVLSHPRVLDGLPEIQQVHVESALDCQLCTHRTDFAGAANK